MEYDDALEQELQLFLRKRRRSKFLTATILVILVILIIGGIFAKTFIRVDKRKKVFLRALDAGNLGVVDRMKELGPEILPELYKRLLSKDPDVRAGAGLSIMKFPENLELERLYPLVEDESENVRAFIIQEAALQVEVPSLNALIVRGLKSTNEKIVTQTIGLLREKIKAAPQENNPVLRTIKELSTSSNKKIRLEAISCLWYWNIPETIKIIEKEYKAGNEDDRIFLLSLIRRRPREDAKALVSKELKSKSKKVMVEALKAATELRLPEAFSIYVKALPKVKDSPEDYADFLRSMAKINAKKAVPYLRKAINSEDPDVYSACREGLMMAGEQ